MDEVTLAATTVITAFLTEMSREAYQKARDTVMRLFQRDGEAEATVQLERLSRDRVTIAQAPEDQRAVLAQYIAGQWAPALGRLARTDEAVLAELVTFAQSVPARTTAARVEQYNHGSGTFIGGNVYGGVTNNHGAPHGTEG